MSEFKYDQICFRSVQSHTIFTDFLRYDLVAVKKLQQPTVLDECREGEADDFAAAFVPVCRPY